LANNNICQTKFAKLLELELFLVKLRGLVKYQQVFPSYTVLVHIPLKIFMPDLIS